MSQGEKDTRPMKDPLLCDKCGAEFFPTHGEAVRMIDSRCVLCPKCKEDK